jgi:RNA 3'-terminal phosphate cyclase
MADQILPCMALADGETAVTLSEITTQCTNMWVIEQFLAGRFLVSDNLIRWRRTG